MHTFELRVSVVKFADITRNRVGTFVLFVPFVVIAFQTIQTAG